MIVSRLVPVLAVLAVYLTAGGALLALARVPVERSLAARCGFAYLLGLAWIGVASWVFGHALGVALSRGSVLVLAAAPLLLAALVNGSRGRSRTLFGTRGARPWRERWLVGLPALLFAFATVALFAEGATHPVEDFDGRMTWGTQARYLLASGSVLPEALRDANAFIVHPRYPIVLPIVQAASALVVEAPISGGLVRPLYVAILPAFFLAVAPTLRRAGRGVGLAAAIALVALAPALVWHGEGGARGTYSDLPLAAFLGAALALLLRRRTARDLTHGLFAGLLLAAAAGSKNEGLLLAPAALALVAADRLWSGRRRSRGGGGRRGLWAAAAVLALALANQLAWRQQIPPRNDEQFFETARAGAVAAGFAERAPAIAREVVRLSADAASWGYLFWLLPLLVWTGRRAFRTRPTRLASAMVLFQVAVAFAAYSVGYEGVIEVTWNRLLVQVALPLALLVAATVGATSKALAPADRAD